MKKAARISGKCFRDLRDVAVAGILALVAFPSFAAPFAYVTEAFSSNVRVIDMATNTEISTLATNASGGGTVVLPSGKFVYVPSGGSRLDVYGTRDNSLVAAIPMPGRPSDIAIHPSGDYIYSVHGGAGMGIILVIDTDTNSIVDSIALRGAYNIAISSDGDEIYVSGNDMRNSVIFTVDANTNTLSGSIILPGRFYFGLAVHPTGLRPCYTDYGDGGRARRRGVCCRSHQFWAYRTQR